jgi:DNA excision repair protein ERCC-2
LGLPEPSAINEQIRSRMAEAFGAAAYDYTYLYPGIQRVVQAGGRIIRGPTDRGHLHLIDDRFCRKSVQQLLPRTWCSSLSEGVCASSAHIQVQQAEVRPDEARGIIG